MYDSSILAESHNNMRRKMMGRIRMLNLFRCSSVGDKMEEKDIHYFVTDYFDGIKVEEPNPATTTLAECMGIKRRTT